MLPPHLQIPPASFEFKPAHFGVQRLPGGEPAVVIVLRTGTAMVAGTFTNEQARLLIEQLTTIVDDFPPPGLEIARSIPGGLIGG
jgi:hypothetical protein